MHRILGLAAISLLGWVGMEAAVAQPKETSRREPFDAGLVLETGVRTGACDVLTFTTDGKALLAVGDDKVVRSWNWSPSGLDLANPQVLRWPTFREHRGNIYALALSPNQKLAAVAGQGTISGTVVIIDRVNEKTVAGLNKIPLEAGNQPYSIWSLAFSPDGKKVVFGNDQGSIFLWNFSSPQLDAVYRVGRHPDRPNAKLNKVKFLHFLDENKILSVAQDGLVYQWGLNNQSPLQIHRFNTYENNKLPGNVQSAALSPQREWLAAAVEGTKEVVLVSLKTKQTKNLNWPDARHYPKAMAFDAAGNRLAVALEAITQNHKFGGQPFSETTGGKIYLFDLQQNPSAPQPGPTVTHYPEAIAFHPKENQLAVAGGADHEVSLWSLNPLKKISETPILGQSIWQVALSTDNRYLAFKTQRAPDPIHPNQRGHDLVPRHTFDLENRRFQVNTKGLTFSSPLDTRAGWEVVPDPANRYRWYVRNGNQIYPLLLDPIDGMPRCYSFLPDKTRVRLAVGHFWGSAFSSFPARVRRGAFESWSAIRGKPCPWRPPPMAACWFRPRAIRPSSVGA